MDELICGKNSVLAALKAGRPINKIVLAKGFEHGMAKEVLALAKELGVPCQEIDRAALSNFAGPNNRGVVAQAAPYEYVEVADILAAAKEKGEDPLVLILADLEDPHNLGAIIRTAESAGVHGIIIPKRRSVALNSTVVQVASGAAEYVPVARVANLNQCLEELKKAGLWVAGADMQGKENLWQATLTGPLALVMGSEGQGIPRLLADNCDFLVQIPQKGQISSLNVSAATAIIIYEVLRQREAKNK